MLGIKISLKKTEQLKKHLLESNLFNKEYKIIKQDNSIIFPLTKLTEAKKRQLKKKFPESEFINYSFIPRKKTQNYKDLLLSILQKSVIDELPSSFDIIGSILILEIKPELIEYEKQIADALLRINKNITTILKKADIHSGEFRTQKLDYIAGEKTKVTVYRENNVRLKLDVEKVYFSPRLSTERKRIYKQVKKGENILVMFSGCGPYPIVLSRNTAAAKITGIEKNPIAHRYAESNATLNKTKNVTLLKGDVRKVLPELDEKFDRILMPLPKGAEDFLYLALAASKKGTIIHFYDFEHESELKKGEKKVKSACKENNKSCKILRTVKCGQYSPGKFRICVDFLIS
ncbi:class I SAM-dependent methyltransferase family protein [Candidatus Woesearchaeota archaeon]|nr:class I SAM-dependent methyltransferase family protein [Candidatus Woesearchaeota archaeon]